MTTQTERIMALADEYADVRSLHGAMRASEKTKEARAALLAALQEQAQVQAREGEAVNPGSVVELAKVHGTRYVNRHYPEKSTYGFTSEGLIAFANAVAAPQPAQPVVKDSLTTQEAQPDHIPDAGKMIAQPEQGEHGWLQSGSLLYRLTDERQPQNCDEINVTMSDGSRSDTARKERAAKLLSMLQSAQPVAQPLPLTDAQVHVAMAAINRASQGDIQATFEEMKAALEAGIGGAR